AICAARGWPMLVLKGGALVGSDAESVDVADLDVLVRPEHALPLAAVLEASGYRKDGIDPGPEHGATAHLATRKPPWGVQVDVHFRVNGIADAESLWAAAEPLAGHPGVLVLRPGAQLHHLLLHTGTQHFNRRGTLRDLLLLASAAARCTPAEMTEVRRAISAHPAADLLSEMLKSALRLRGGGDADDPYRSVVLANYWIHAAPPSRHVPAVLLDAALLSLFSLLAPGDSYRRAFRARLMAGQLAHAPGFGVVHRISPRAAAAIQTAGRAALMAAVALPAWAGARRIAALAKGTGRTGDSE
ncbi:MAG TPA: nucleotidyltransferase family protein, partial [Longimicrobiaceae bacterium]|nr:nucleotidyltransferase family protein [Longimicrobiaceae bacterium]